MFMVPFSCQMIYNPPSTLPHVYGLIEEVFRGNGGFASDSSNQSGTKVLLSQNSNSCSWITFGVPNILLMIINPDVYACKTIPVGPKSS
jgi:hypothetical protein